MKENASGCFFLNTVYDDITQSYGSDYSEMFNADSLNSNFLQPYSSEEGVAAGHSGQFTLGGYLSTLWYTLL